jgi:hypothetical protein
MKEVDAVVEEVEEHVDKEASLASTAENQGIRLVTVDCQRQVHIKEDLFATATIVARMATRKTHAG